MSTHQCHFCVGTYHSNCNIHYRLLVSSTGSEKSPSCGHKWDYLSSCQIEVGKYIGERHLSTKLQFDRVLSSWQHMNNFSDTFFKAYPLYLIS